MRRILLLVLLSGFIFCAQRLPAQENTPEDKNQETQAASDAAAQEEVRVLEHALVRRVLELLAKQVVKRAGAGPAEVQAPDRATPPRPEPHDRKKLEEEIEEWESKSLSFIEGLKLQELAELAEKQKEQTKKLADKIGNERLVVNKRRQGEQEEEGKLERILSEELSKLKRKFEQEERKIEQNYKQEKKEIEQTAKKLRESIKSSDKKKANDKQGGKSGPPSRPRPRDNQPPGRKALPKPGKK